MALVKSILLVDGENLVFRFQDMVQKGHKPKKDVVHIPDVFIWHPNLASRFNIDIFRVIYYTSTVGDDERIQSIRNQISKNIFDTGRRGMGNYFGHCQLVPNVFKKNKQSQKSRLVDIFIAVDAMKYASNPSIECLVFLSGDSDFIKLYNELMSFGKKVLVGSFSDGCASPLNHVVDDFFKLDSYFFEKKA